MNAAIKLTLLAITLSSALAAQATSLPWRSIYGGSIGAFDVVEAPFGGTLLESMSVQYRAPPTTGPHLWGTPLAPAIESGTFKSAVYESTAGTLDFYYQIADVKGVPDGGIRRAVDLDIAHFGDFGGSTGSIQGDGTTSGNWSLVGSDPGKPLSIFQTNATFGIFSAGTVSADGAARESGVWAGQILSIDGPGNSTVTDIHIGFSQDIGLLTDAATYTFIIRTGLTPTRLDQNGVVVGLGYETGKNSLGIGDDVQHKDLGFTGHQTFSGVYAIVPSIPEPESYALMLAGLGLIGAVVRRRKASRV
jgi:hypothetical protein